MAGGGPRSLAAEAPAKPQRKPPVRLVTGFGFVPSIENNGAFCNRLAAVSNRQLCAGAVGYRSV